MIQKQKAVSKLHQMALNNVHMLFGWVKLSKIIGIDFL